MITTIIIVNNAIKMGAKNLSEQAKKARKEYQRQWRKANPEKWEAIVKRFWEKKAAEFNGDNKHKDQ